MSRGRRKCHFCPNRTGLTTIERGYIPEQIRVCPTCFMVAVKWHRHYTQRRIAGKNIADPHQMILL